MTVSRIKQFELELQREFALERVETILREAPAVLSEKVAWIRECFENEWRHSIVSRYQVAVIIRDVYNDVTDNNGSIYGARAVEALKKAFGWDDGVIYRALHVAEAFTPEQIEAFTQMRLPGGQPLSFSHVVSLAAVEEERDREKFLKQAVKEGWTARKLANAIVPTSDQQEDKQKDRRGRPLAKPRDFDAVLDQQEHFVQDFLNRNSQVWSHQEYSLSTRAKELDAADFTRERADRLKRHVEVLSLLAEKAKERADEASRVHALFVRVLKEQDAQHKKLNSPETAGVSVDAPA